MNICPRCESSEQYLRTEHQGREDGILIWTVFHCTRCRFTWRDSEPAEVIDRQQRDPDFNVDPDHPEQYPYNIPPVRTGQ